MGILNRVDKKFKEQYGKEANVFKMRGEDKKNFISLLADEIAELSYNQFNEEYNEKTQGVYLKKNTGSRDFLKHLGEEKGVDPYFVLENLKDCVNLQISINLDNFTTRERRAHFNDNRSFQEEDIKPIFIVKSNYFYEDERGDGYNLALYTKFDFITKRFPNGEVKEVLNIKSCHLDSEVHGSKSEELSKVRVNENEYYRCINKDDYLDWKYQGREMTK